MASYFCEIIYFIEYQAKITFNLDVHLLYSLDLALSIYLSHCEIC